MSEYGKYILGKFSLALEEVCIPEVAENYEFEKHTNELNLCVMALVAMGED